MASLIPRAELPVLLAALDRALEEHGHPDAVPREFLVANGVTPDTADKCLALLESEDIPLDPALAYSAWLHLIGECV